VSIGWRSRSGKADYADDDEDDRISVAERKITAAHLVKEKKHPDGNDDSGTH